MSIWDKIQELMGTSEVQTSEDAEVSTPKRDASRYAFVDVEVGMKDKKVYDVGALRSDGATFHAADKRGALAFLEDVDFVCGHNIIHHDAKYLLGEEADKWALVDTLYVSPLLFPERPYHKLLKDDKLVSEQMNNPVNDCEKARDLLMDEVARWNSLSESKRLIYASLLHDISEFRGFLGFVGAETDDKVQLASLIREEYEGKMCANADIDGIVREQPVELAYALALIDTTDYRSITPAWVLHNYPNMENVVKRLRHTRCEAGCAYCRRDLDVHHNLKQFFGYDNFRTYEGEPLQENAARAAVEGKSLLAIFPTSGGKWALPMLSCKASAIA